MHSIIDKVIAVIDIYLIGQFIVKSQKAGHGHTEGHLYVLVFQI